MRILLFLATNAAVLVLISIVFQLFGIEGILDENGVDLNLKALQCKSEPKDLPGEFAAFGISGAQKIGLKRLFMSHPSLEERIAALEAQV